MPEVRLAHDEDEAQADRGKRAGKPARPNDAAPSGSSREQPGQEKHERELGELRGFERERPKREPAPRAAFDEAEPGTSTATSSTIATQKSKGQRPQLCVVDAQAHEQGQNADGGPQQLSLQVVGGVVKLRVRDRGRC